MIFLLKKNRRRTRTSWCETGGTMKYDMLDIRVYLDRDKNIKGWVETVNWDSGEPVLERIELDRITSERIQALALISWLEFMAEQIEKRNSNETSECETF